MLIEAVRKLAEDYPDAVYNETYCRYSVGEAGPGEGCIIGQAVMTAFPSCTKAVKKLDKLLQ